jgi:hypothetical protein
LNSGIFPTGSSTGWSACCPQRLFRVCRKQLLELEPVKRVLAIMRGEEFQQAISELPGYRCKDAGVVKTVQDAFQRSA